MPAAAVATLVLVGILVVALAFYLTWVVLILRGITDTLGKVTFGVRSIAHRTGPLSATLPPMNDDLEAVADALESLADRVHPGRPTAKVPTKVRVAQAAKR